MAAISGCSKPACPQGSVEIDGKCRAADASDGGSPEGDSGTQPQHDAGSQTPDSSLGDCETGRVPRDGQCVRDRCVAIDGEPAACGEHGRCSAGTATDPICDCDEGYFEAAAQCLRDACVALPDEPAGCGAHAICTRGDGGEAICACEEGYAGDGLTCERNACVQLADEAPPCGANQLCSATTPGEKLCACNEDFADCDADPATGCEVDTTSHLGHCGACDHACAAGLSCDDGSCAARVTAMSLGVGGACAVTPENDVLCWGKGGLLHGRGLTSSNIPVAIDIGKATGVSTGNGHACAMSAGDSSVRCWGESNALHQLGGSDTSAKRTDLPIAGARGVAAGKNGGCAIDAIGHVFCWGTADLGQLGDGRPYVQGEHRAYDSSAPVMYVTQAIDVRVGEFISCALTGGGTVYCWGNEPTMGNYLAEQIRGREAGAPILNDAAELCVGFAHACARRHGGSIVCWGLNTYGALGTGSAAAPARNTHVQVDVPPAVELSCRGGTTCVRTEDGELHCWGFNGFGQLGRGSTDGMANAPGLVPGFVDVTAVYMGDQTACARKRGGHVYCWGQGQDGELGTGMTYSAPVPTPQALMYWP